MAEEAGGVTIGVRLNLQELEQQLEQLRQLQSQAGQFGMPGGGREPVDYGGTREMSIQNYIEQMRQMGEVVGPVLEQQTKGVIVMERIGEMLHNLEVWQSTSPGGPREVGLSPYATQAERAFALFSEVVREGEGARGGLWSEKSRKGGQMEYSNVTATFEAFIEEKELQQALLEMRTEEGLGSASKEFRVGRWRKVDVATELADEILFEETKRHATAKDVHHFAAMIEEQKEIAERGEGLPPHIPAPMYVTSMTEQLAQRQTKEQRAGLVEVLPYPEELMERARLGQEQAEAARKIADAMTPALQEAKEKAMDAAGFRSLIPDLFESAREATGIDTAMEGFEERVLNILRARGLYRASLAKFWVDAFGTKTFFPDIVKEFTASAEGAEAYGETELLMRQMRRALGTGEEGYTKLRDMLFGPGGTGGGAMGPEPMYEMFPPEMADWLSQMEAYKKPLGVSRGWDAITIGFELRKYAIAQQEAQEEARAAAAEGRAPAALPMPEGGYEAKEAWLRDQGLIGEHGFYAPGAYSRAWNYILPWLRGAVYAGGSVPETLEDVRAWVQEHGPPPELHDPRGQALAAGAASLGELITRLRPALAQLRGPIDWERFSPGALLERYEHLAEQGPGAVTPPTGADEEGERQRVEAETRSVEGTLMAVQLANRPAELSRIEAIREQARRQLLTWGSASTAGPGLSIDPRAAEAMTKGERQPIIIQSLNIQSPDLEGAIREVQRRARVRTGTTG